MALDKVDAGVEPDPRRLLATAVSVARYAGRASARATPFGLFAGVVAGYWSSGPAFVPGGHDRKHVRLDAEGLLAEVRYLLRDPGFRGSTSVMLNDLCHVRGGRLVLPHVRDLAAAGDGTSNKDHGVRERTVRRGRVVDWLLARTVAPIRYADLLDEGVTMFGETARDRLDELLGRLVDMEFLLCSATPRHPAPAALQDVIDLAVAAESTRPRARRLERLRDALDRYAGLAPGEGRDALAALDDDLAPWSSAGRPVIQVDLEIDAEVRLPRLVAEEIEAYAWATWRLSTGSTVLPHLRRWLRHFVDRYGQGVEVALADVLDPATGLGFPDGYRAAPADTDAADGPHDTDPAAPSPDHRREVLARLLHDALQDPRREVLLDEDTVAALASRRPSAPLPAPMDLSMQVHAESSAALAAGDFLLSPSAGVGAMTAGSTAARFGAALHGSAERAPGWRDDHAGGPLRAAVPIEAEVRFLPRQPRMLNVVGERPPVPHTIPVGMFEDRTSDHVIDWRDLALAVEGDDVVVRQMSSGRRVLPRATHMMNLSTGAPDVARLLVEVGLGRHRIWQPWSWAGLEDQPWLPRVRLGRTVLSPAHWKVDGLLRSAASTRTGWVTALRRWRSTFRVPSSVAVVLDDRSSALDLDDGFDQEIFRRQVEATAHMAVVERLAGCGWSGGRAAELVAELAPVDVEDPPSASHHLRAPRAPTMTAYPPGGEWVYARLYPVDRELDSFLVDELEPLLAELEGSADRWFFIRYRDTRPHVRLRVHGQVDDVLSSVLPTLHARMRTWSDRGLARDLVLDTYRPEYARYGGVAAMADAEAVFTVDSAAALAELAATRDGRGTLPRDVVVALHHALLLDALGDWDWCAWVGRALATSATPTAFREYRSVLRDVIHPGAMVESTSAVLPEAARLPWRAEALRRFGGHVLVAHDDSQVVARDSALLGMLHMQHNRLVGPDRTRERKSLDLLGALVRDHHFRGRGRGR